MNNVVYLVDSYIKRYRDLLKTSVDAAERQMLQRLIEAEKAKSQLHASQPKAE
jgi:hypothetical protein